MVVGLVVEVAQGRSRGQVAFRPLARISMVLFLRRKFRKFVLMSLAAGHERIWAFLCLFSKKRIAFLPISGHDRKPQPSMGSVLSWHLESICSRQDKEVANEVSILGIGRKTKRNIKVTSTMAVHSKYQAEMGKETK